MKTRLALALVVSATAVNGLWDTLAYGHTAHPDTFAQLAWMHRWADPAALPGDVCADYFRTYHVPPGLRALYYTLIVGLGVPILAAAKAIAVAAFFLTIGLLYAVGRAAADNDPAGGLAAVAVGCGLDALEVLNEFSPLMTAHTGLARGFAVPCLLTVMLGLTMGRAWISSLGLIGGVLFYPPSFAVGGAAIGLQAVAALLQGNFQAGLKQALYHLPVGVVAGVVVIAFYPPLEQEKYGRTFPFEVAVRMPEFRAPGTVSWTEPMLRGDDAFIAAVRPWFERFWPVLVLLGALFIRLRPTGNNGFVRALASLTAASLACSMAAILLWFRLYEPSRYWVYPFRALFAPAAGALLAHWLGREIRSREKMAALLAVAVAAVELLAFTTRLGRYPVPPAAPPVSIRAALAAAPADALVAFYPGDGDWAPLLTQRPGLVSSIALFPYHDCFHPAALARFTAVRDAVYATDPTPIRKLRSDYRVRYLLYSKSRFEPAEFIPLLTWYPGVTHLAHLTRDLAQSGPDRPFLLKTPPEKGIEATEGDYVLLNLERWAESEFK